MDVPEWVLEMGKVGAGAVAGVFAGTRRMESRVRALEARAAQADQTLVSHEQTLTEVHETVQADHDLLIEMAAVIEGLRRGAIVAIERAQTEADVTAAIPEAWP